MFGQKIGIEFPRYRVDGGLAVVVLFGQVFGCAFGGNGSAAAGKRVGAVGVGQGCTEHKVGDGLCGCVLVFAVADGVADDLRGIGCQSIGRQLQIPLAAQCAGNQGFGGAKRTAFAAAYAPASGFLVGLGVGGGMVMLPSLSSERVWPWLPPLSCCGRVGL